MCSKAGINALIDGANFGIDFFFVLALVFAKIERQENLGNFIDSIEHVKKFVLMFSLTRHDERIDKYENQTWNDQKWQEFTAKKYERT